jgi:hypothetical protein
VFVHAATIFHEKLAQVDIRLSLLGGNRESASWKRSFFIHLDTTGGLKRLKVC